MNNQIRLGIPVTGTRNWLGGVFYIENLVRALTSLPIEERPYLSLITDSFEMHDFYAPFLPVFDEIIYYGRNLCSATKLLGKQPTCCPSFGEALNHIDLFFPGLWQIFQFQNVIYWLPDFQHCYLPHLFQPEEIEFRNKLYSDTARLAKLLILSSQHAEADFRKFYPDSKTETHILSFHTLPPPEWYQPDPVIIQHKYNLPEEFFLCSNQFWAHKSHITLFQAVARLKQQNRAINLVCTGPLEDYRNPDYFPNLKQFIHDAALDSQIYILGTIPRLDQIQLMRRSLAVIQPSLFEGWSTVIEDARALGKTILMSDISVHLEQAPQHGHYFARKDEVDLAQKIHDLLPTLEPGPIVRYEDQARKAAKTLNTIYARTFCNILFTTRHLFNY